MSFSALPVLFLNLGGEMMYILEQRLKAQNIPTAKSSKVVTDIVGTMLNKRFMEEIFKPQELYGKKAIRTMFDRLAHSSIMRLNSASMDKLYDLMTMAFKYQLTLCLRPRDILLITLNHLDALRSMVIESDSVTTQVENAYRLFAQHLRPLNDGQMVFLRQTLLNFFQDIHVRVSIFLKEKSQSNNGRFVLKPGGKLPWGFQSPLEIRIFDGEKKLIKKNSFPVKSTYTVTKEEGSFDIKGSRVTTLGTNMYSVSSQSDAAKTVKNPFDTTGHRSDLTSDIESMATDPKAKAQLDYLCQLLSADTDASSKKVQGDLRLNLFQNDEEEREAEKMLIDSVGGDSKNTVAIDARISRQKNPLLAQIMQEMNINDDSGKGGKLTGDELLDLMDG